MADVATLIFDIDSSGALGAAKALAKMDRAAASAATMSAKLEKTFRSSNGQFQSQAKFAKENESEIKRLAAAYNLTLSTQLRYAEAQREVARAVQLGVISSAQQADILRDLSAQYAPLSDRQAAVIKQTGLMSGGFKNATSHIQNAGYQIGDFAVQIASGQNAMMAMSQQLPQLLGGFGAWGAAAGAVTAILGAGYMVWSNASGAAATLDDTVSNLSLRLSALDAAVEMSLLPMDQLISKYGSAARAAREWLLINIQKEVMETNDALRKQAGAISDIASEYASALNPTMEMLRVELNAIEDDFGIIGAEASQFREILFSIRNADGLDKQVEYLEEMRVFLKDNNIEIAKMPEGFAKSLVSLSPLVAKAWELAQANRAAAAAAKEETTGTPLYEQGYSGQGLLPPAVVRPRGTGGGGGGGGRAVEQAQKQFQSLRELLEQNTLFEMAEYEKRQSQLDNALSKRLLSEQSYNLIKDQLQTFYFGSEYEKQGLRFLMEQEQLDAALAQRKISEERHAEEVSRIRAAQQNASLSGYATFFGNLASAAQAGGDRTTKAVKAFSVAQGILNSYLAYTQVLADPSLIGRPFLRTALAASTLAAGLGAVASMKSGGGGSAASTASAAVKQEPQRVALVKLTGDKFLVDLADDIMTQIYEASGDGRVIVQRDY